MALSAETCRAGLGSGISEVMMRRLKQRPLILLVPALALVAAGCGVIGSGDLVAEAREVGSFDNLDISEGINVQLVVDPGAVPSVSVYYDDNLLDKVITEVRGDTLTLEFDGSVTVTGSGRFVDVVVGDLGEIEISGGADLEGTGTVDGYRLTASGGADVDLSDLVAETVEVDASGGADVRVHASASIDGEASGGADVRIYGDPDHSRVDTSGGADVDYEN
jgi:hypothetical protein